MAKILISSLFKQAVTPFPNGFFSFGATDAAFANRTQNNITISKATDVESTRTNMATDARISQNAGGFSSTNIYHVKGYDVTLNNDVNKVLCATDTQAIPTINFTNNRRGPFGPLPPYLGRIYYFGGYNDSTGLYTNASTYISTPTDTIVNTTNIPAVRHVGTTLFNASNAWLIGGTTTGGGGTNTIYRWAFSTDSVSTLAETDTISGSQAYGINYTSFGYRALGVGATRTSGKFTYSTEIMDVGTACSTTQADAIMHSGTQYVTESAGYLWTGYRGSTLWRTLLQLTFATEAWDDRKYLEDVGWIQSTSGA
jgi:hypothetical protein